MEGLAVHPSTGCNLLAHGQSEPPQAFEHDQQSCSFVVVNSLPPQVVSKFFGAVRGYPHAPQSVQTDISALHRDIFHGQPPIKTFQAVWHIFRFYGRC